MAASRIDPREHSRYPWRLNEIASDFDLIDAWALPAGGTFDEFANLAELFGELGHSPGGESSSLTRMLFDARHRLGERFGWDRDSNKLGIPGRSESTLRDRLPNDLEAETSETYGSTPFRPVYKASDEFALELSNSTMHAIVHLAWVPASAERYHGQMGIYVKPRGRFGRMYMWAIAPFRHHIVYPALMRQIEQAWNDRQWANDPPQ